MGLKLVLCPNEKCGHKFPTEKEDTQCGKCGKRFPAKSNAIISSKTQNEKNPLEQEKQIKKIVNLLTILSNRYTETGATIQQIQDIVEAIKK